MAEEKRILAIDPGERRVGLAVSDPLGITAQGLDTFDRGSGDLMSHLERLIKTYSVVQIVVGHPLSLSGHEGDAGRSARELARTIESDFGVAVVLWDERLSSVEAQRVLAPGRRRRDKGAVDRVAAALILQSYLDAKGGA